MQGDFLVKDWLVQPQINTIEKAGKCWHIEPKVMQVLVHLALHSGEVLSKERLIETIWRDTFVGDDVLVRCISEIRYVFGDDARSPTVIQTIPKAGYRLIAPVTMELGTATDPRIQADSTTMRSNGHHSEKLRSAEVPSETPSVSTVKPSRAEDVSEPAQKGDPFSVQPDAMQQAPLGAAARPKSSQRFAWSVAAIACVMMLVVAAAWGWRSFHPSPFSLFWAQILETPEPALFCIADQNQYSFITLRDAAEPARQVVLKDNLSAVVIDDLDTIVRVAAALRAHGKQYQLKGEERTSLSDLRNGPSIFIGAFDNAWTLRLTKPLRFHFANNSDMTQFRIVDGNNPSAQGWVVDRTQQMATNNYTDFAILARFTDSNTGKPAIIIAGIGRGGTIAAGEFLTDPDDLSKLLRIVQTAGNKKNLEIVLSTQIIDGQPGSPKVEASYFW